MSNYKELLTEINTMIFDFDGVLTDGKVHLTERGELVRTTNVKDGYALQIALKQGFNVAILTGGKSKVISARFHSLGIEDVFQNVTNKLNTVEKYVMEKKLDYSKVLYMGDDIPDYFVMKNVKVPCCPADAVNEIKEISVYISDHKGGQGCVRDIIEQTLKVQGKWLVNNSKEW